MKSRRWMLVALAACLSAACQTTDRIVLLPDAHGNAGRVVVSSRSGEQTLVAPYAAVDVDTGGGLTQHPMDSAMVRSRYAAVLDALPPRPASFMLYFESGSATELTSESKAMLDTMKAELARRPAPEITVIGHTDTVGTVESNDVLSRQRAESMLAVLQAAGVQAISLDVAGRGERELAIKTADGVAEARNRRVEINVR